MAKNARKSGTPKKNSADDVEPETQQSTSTTSSTQATRPRGLRWSLLLDNNVRRSTYLILLAATYAPLSQLILSPVFGSIPSSVYHRYGVLGSAMLGLIITAYIPPIVERFFASFAFWIPLIHFGLFQYSSTLGNPLGPLVIECLTVYPLIMVALHLAVKQFDEIDLGLSGAGMVEAVPSMINYTLFILLERVLKGTLPRWMGMNVFFTRVGLQMLIAATFTSILPQSLIWPSLPAIAFTTIANPHAPLALNTQVLQNTLALYNYTLIERIESSSGYLSVLQDYDKKFRVLRSDHSLLGGNWIAPASRGKVPDPIFAVFTMLESVRLVERGSKQSQGQENALNIGLGVGTVPAALMAHGVNMTIIELDPNVHRFAVKHFGLPTKHWAYIGDAEEKVEGLKDSHTETYDYIIHDVFTGGAEPVHLFTFEFLSGLRQMLKQDGVIAINYAGDLAMSSTSLIYRTITELFPSCRVFREDEQIAGDNDIHIEDAGDFTNLVFICNKGQRPVQFRKAIEADFLGSASRKSYMVPKHEVPRSRFETQGELLTRRNARALAKMQVQSAIGHWKLMRKVIPDAIWENW